MEVFSCVWDPPKECISKKKKKQEEEGKEKQSLYICENRENEWRWGLNSGQPTPSATARRQEAPGEAAPAEGHPASACTNDTLHTQTLCKLCTFLFICVIGSDRGLWPLPVPRCVPISRSCTFSQPCRGDRV